MATPASALLNVFSGPNALKDFHDPDKNVYLPLVELPFHPFSEHKVRIYAKMLTMVPSANVKALPALNMMRRAQEAGDFDPVRDCAVEYSSGNTVLSLGILHRLYGSPESKTMAYISNKTSTQKIQLLRFFGLELSLFGGPAQVEPSDPMGGIHAAIQDGMKPNHWNPGQYSSSANSEAHVRCTGPQIYKQLPNISVFAASIGTSGTMTGTGSYLKSVLPNIVNLGVFTAPGDRVPGPRPIDLIQAVDLPWWEVIDCDEHVTSYDSYLTSLDLCRQGILCGPSSGLALKGLFQYLAKSLKESPSGLDHLRGSDGFVTCAFICCDLPFQYIAEYFTKLPPSCFPKIHREELLDADLYPYGISWRISAKEASDLLSKSPKAVILDLRDQDDFARCWCSVAKSVNLDLKASNDPNPFTDSATLVRQWTDLSNSLNPRNARYGYLYGREVRDVVVMSYDGYSASIACSIMRYHNASAYYIDGGFASWRNNGLPVFTEDFSVRAKM